VEIGEERDERMSDVQLQRSADGKRVGVGIARPDGKVTLWFTPEGPASVEQVR
jgi:hypothetical protein